jgi:hypothetical protein
MGYSVGGRWVCPSLSRVRRALSIANMNMYSSYIHFTGADGQTARIITARANRNIRRVFSPYRDPQSSTNLVTAIFL